MPSMFPFYKLSIFSLFLLLHLDDVAVQYAVKSSNGLCVQAAGKPKTGPPCVALVHNTYCKSKGIHLDPFVFMASDKQKKNDKMLNKFENVKQSYSLFLPISPACLEAIDNIYCHHYFPKCDNTSSTLRAQRLCKESCLYFRGKCSAELRLIRSLASSAIDIINCDKLPLRNAGMSPECYYFVGQDDGTGATTAVASNSYKDCLQGDGNGYQGNVSVTSSGISCQSWTSHCPHRHTMDTTYPELKNSSNFCRNPLGSGQQPWCFTTDPNKRWEYCNIPRCLPATTVVTTMVPQAKTATKIKTSSISTTTMTSVKATLSSPTNNSNNKTESFSTRSTSLVSPVTTTTTVETTSRTCSPALRLPRNDLRCIRLNEMYGQYCRRNGIKLDSKVFRSLSEQKRYNNNLERYALAKETIMKFQGLFQFGEKCKQALDVVYCHYYFPSCDQTGQNFAEQRLCRTTCEFLWNVCKEEFKAAIKTNKRIDLIPQWRNYWDLINCTLLPTRKAGSSPECWYYTGKNLKANSTRASKDECLYLDGSDYQGNISVTSSGISCQSWTTQCPHRHTMDTTYPELKNSSNFCRNPRGSGQRPWCFTTDPHKRWEYCNVAICPRIQGGYGNWTLSRGCSVTCGRGVEVWTRSCDSPAPRHGGKNCSTLGHATEYRNCSNLPPCPVNGNYGKWIENSTCNVTCGKGFKKFIRICDNPSPAFGGRDCSFLGDAEKWESCIESCREGPEVVGNPGYYDNNGQHNISFTLSKHHRRHEVFQRNTKTILIAVGTVVVLVFVVGLGTFIHRRIKQVKKGYEPYATLLFRGCIPLNLQRAKEDQSEQDSTTASSTVYGNLTESGQPIPGVSRGIVPYRRIYVNVHSLSEPHYSKLQLFSSITVDWLRNAWGHVDEIGKHVYDMLSRGMELVLPYDHLKNVFKNGKREIRNGVGAIDNNENSLYDHADHRTLVILAQANVDTSSPNEVKNLETQDDRVRVDEMNQSALVPTVC